MRVDSIFGGPPGGEEDEEESVGAAAAVLSEAAPEAATWIAVRMTDNSGDPVKSLRYEVKLPNGDVRKGTLDDNGLARIESPTSGECTVSFPDLDASDWDAGAAVAATAATTTPPKDAAKRAYFGTLQGPSGPLAQWPFTLERAGQALDVAALDGGRSSNEYRDGFWFSGAQGEFRFDDLPEGDYTIEVLGVDGELVPNDAPAPEGVGESGHRAPLPEPLDPLAFSEDPQELVPEDEE
jgi:hypothetical protein